MTSSVGHPPRFLLGLPALLALACNGSSPDQPAEAGAGSDAPMTVILDGGGVIPDPPNGESACPAGACNYQTQSGCADPTPACRPNPVGAGLTPGCWSAGTAVSGEPCPGGWPDCVRGTICVLGACRTLCCGGDWSACPSGESCIRQLDVPVADAAVSSGADLCFPVGTCDVLDPASCTEPGRACQIVDPTGSVACAPAGSGDVGAECGTAAPCSAGQSCVGGACRRLCRAVAGGGEPSCPASEGICVHFNRDPTGVGECTPY